MKNKELLLDDYTNTNELLQQLNHEEIGDDHLYTGIETPMKDDAFALSDSEKKKRISQLFAEIMDVMGLDLTDDSLRGTPMRVAKMYIDEIFSGLKSINITRCWSKKILLFILIANIILCLSLGKHTLPIFLLEK